MIFKNSDKICQFFRLMYIDVYSKCEENVTFDLRKLKFIE